MSIIIVDSPDNLQESIDALTQRFAPVTFARDFHTVCKLLYEQSYTKYTLAIVDLLMFNEYTSDQGVFLFSVLRDKNLSIILAPTTGETVSLLPGIDYDVLHEKPYNTPQLIAQIDTLETWKKNGSRLPHPFIPSDQLI